MELVDNVLRADKKGKAKKQLSIPFYMNILLILKSNHSIRQYKSKSILFTCNLKYASWQM